MSKYRILATAAGMGLIALSIYNFKDCNSLRDNPNLTAEVSGILELQRDRSIINQAGIDEYNNRPDYARVWSFDDKSRDLLDKLTEPSNTRLKTFADLYEHYSSELDRRTMTNQTWKNYCKWERETKANNKSGLLYGSLAFLSGLGLLALSRKN